MKGISNQFSLEGKVVVVTGGTGVLGKSFVNSIANGGGKVAILGRNIAVAEERAKEINDNGGVAIAIVADVMDEGSLIKAKDQILKTFGKIDALVNGAGGNMPGAVVNPEDDIFKLNI